MNDLEFRTLDGRSTTVRAADLDALAAAFDGHLIDASSPNYDAARAIWNGMIDRRPALIARCQNPNDVVAAVRFARQHDVLIAVRGGGHNIAGNALCDGGIVIDLSLMKQITVNAGTRTARVEPGCTLADFDREAQKHGMATPLGINSTTGVAGLALGGGFGWLSRSFGLTSDNLAAADIVTADGELRRATETENADLFWAIRGGGGNFGIVTGFEFRLHAVGPEILSGLIVHPFDDAPSVLRSWRDALTQAPDPLSVWVVMRKAPPLPFLPAEWHGREIVVLAACWVGVDQAAGERALEPFRRIGNPIADVIGRQPYAAWQQAFDPLLAPGSRNYWKSHNFTTLSDRALDVACDFIARLPDPQCEVFFGQVGGVINRIPVAATAYADRTAQLVMNVHSRWEDPARDRACIDWARAVSNAMRPFASGYVYMNFLTQDETDRVRDAYGPNFKRLSSLKEVWDPDNRFRVNHNVAIRPPTGAVAD